MDLAILFLDRTLKAQATKEKVDKLDYITIKKFCAPTDSINKMNRQPMEWEKIFPNPVSDKGLISKIYKKLIQLNNNNKILFKSGQIT